MKLKIKSLVETHGKVICELANSSPPFRPKRWTIPTFANELRKLDQFSTLPNWTIYRILRLCNIKFIECIKLTDGEMAKLLELANCKSTHPQQIIRIKIILLLHRGLKIYQLPGILNIKISAVKKVREKYLREGLMAALEVKKSVETTWISEDEMSAVISICELVHPKGKHCWIAKEILSELRNRPGFEKLTLWKIRVILKLRKINSETVISLKSSSNHKLLTHKNLAIEIMRLFKNGHSNSQIEEMLGVSPPTVSKVHKRFKETLLEVPLTSPYIRD